MGRGHDSPRLAYDVPVMQEICDMRTKDLLTVEHFLLTVTVGGICVTQPYAMEQQCMKTVYNTQGPANSLFYDISSVAVRAHGRLTLLYHIPSGF